ncbi:DUF4190 domain-containing protein [Thermodesulfobacteriota bacterium]
MECINHAGVEATNRCAGCAEAFCDNCLVEMKGQKYCAKCKQMAITESPPQVEEGTIPCKEASEALKYAILGIFCFGIILGPVAISKANKAKKMIEKNPQLTGSGKATAAMIIGIIVSILWVLGVISKIANQ